MKTIWAAGAALAGALALGLLAAGAADSAPGVRVIPVSISETRHKTLAPDRVKFQMPSGLKLSLHVVGDLAAKASRYGYVKVTRALTDTGEDLARPAGKTMFAPKAARGFVTINSWCRRGLKDGFTLDVEVSSPPRKATRITSLTGQFKLLAGGKTVEVLVKDARSLAGREVDHPALKAAGLKVKIVKSKLPVAGEPEKEISYEPTGNVDALLEAELVDPAGKPIRCLRSSLQVGDRPRTYSLRAARGKLPAKAGLRLKLLSGAQVTTVPLALKDIPLP